MPYGGLSPFPSPYGGGEPVAETILRSLNQGMGPAYDTSEGTMVYAENANVAREIAAAWATNQRLSNQGDPRRVTTCLARWERLLSLRVDPSDSDVTRRDRVGDHVYRFGQPATHDYVVDLLTSALGSFFVDVKYITYAEAVITVPDGTYPWGTVVSGAPWSSTVLHILVKTQKPSGYTEGQFYSTVGQVFQTLDPIVSSWCTFDWYRNGAGHTGVWSTDTEAGFFLDDESNLDNQIFDV